MNQEIFGLTYTEDLYLVSPPLTVVLESEWADLTADEISLLGKILGSVKQSLNGVRIICSKTVQSNTFPEGARVICFGAVLFPAVPSYQPTEADGAVFIQADALGALDEVKKKNLWTAMKAAFL